MKVYKCLACDGTCAGGKGLPLKCPRCHRGPIWLRLIGKV